MIDFIDKKQMYDSVIMGKEMLLKSGILLYRCFWRVLCLFCVWLCIFYVYML